METTFHFNKLLDLVNRSDANYIRFTQYPAGLGRRSANPNSVYIHKSDIPAIIDWFNKVKEEAEK